MKKIFLTKKRKKFTRKEILERLRREITEGMPIIGAGSSVGIVAKCAELGGADLIMVYATGIYRIMGLPSTILGDNNKITLSMAKELLHVVEDTPVIAGIQADDPRITLDALLKKTQEVGYSGIINFPSVAMHGPVNDPVNARWRWLRDGLGLGFPRELEMMRMARKMDMLTMAYCYQPDDAKAMVEAGVDVMCAHAGGTKGGLVGFRAITKEAAVKKVQAIIEGAKAADPDVICLAHGGPFTEPNETQYLYEHTDAVGFVGASSIERIPIEKAVTECLRNFKSFKIKTK